MAETKQKKRFSLFRRKKPAVQAVAKKKVPVAPQAKAPVETPKNPESLPTVVSVENTDTVANEPTTPVADNREKSMKNQKDVKMKPSWLARRKFFIKMTDNAFDLVDADSSGEVDEKELYAGLLLIHLKLGIYAGPAACKPVDHERVLSVFHKMDVDGSKSLDRDEFREVMMILFSNVLLRVAAQWSMTLILVPFLAQGILDGIAWLWDHAMNAIADLDEYSPIFDAVETFVEETKEKAINALPDSVMSVLLKGKGLIDDIPDSVWSTIPLTLLAAVLGMIAVPWTLFKIDDFFQKTADKKKDEHKTD